jgi:hypothetical protein
VLARLVAAFGRASRELHVDAGRQVLEIDAHQSPTMESIRVRPGL